MEWISVKDRLPEPDVDVLLWFSGSDTMVVGSIVYPDDIEHWTCNTGGEWYADCEEIPSHWMSLPKPPVVHGEWIPNTDDFTPKCKCSVCGYNKPVIAGENVKQEPENYCPNCRAKMDKRD